MLFRRLRRAPSAPKSSAFSGLGGKPPQIEQGILNKEQGIVPNRSGNWRASADPENPLLFIPVQGHACAHNPLHRQLRRLGAFEDRRLDPRRQEGERRTNPDIAGAVTFPSGDRAGALSGAHLRDPAMRLGESPDQDGIRVNNTGPRNDAGLDPAAAHLERGGYLEGVRCNLLRLHAEACDQHFAIERDSKLPRGNPPGPDQIPDILMGIPQLLGQRQRLDSELFGFRRVRSIQWSLM